MPNDTNNTVPEQGRRIQPHLVHTHDVQLDTDYTQWLVELKARYRSAQLKAAVRVNAEKLLFNWQLGRDLVIKKAESRWGEGIVEQLSLDLKAEFPGETGFSTTNLWDMKKWYLTFANNHSARLLLQLQQSLTSGGIEVEQKLRQLVGEITNEKLRQPVGELSATPDETEFPLVLSLIPWGHYVKLIHKTDTPEEIIYYIRQIILQGWNRDTLMAALRDDEYRNQTPALSNFSTQLPEATSTMALEMTKDNYDFSFISLRHRYNERQLEDALESNITQFLMELGTGFAFLGRQREVLISGKDRKVDLLFYHIKLKCYIVVELKAKPFQPEFASKLNFYVNAVNRYVKTDDENPTIGLLICTSFDRTEAELAFGGISTPLAIATYGGVKLSDVLPSEELLRQRVRQLEEELRLSRKLIHKLTEHESHESTES